MTDKTLEQVVRQYVPLPSVPSGGGWYPLLCKICNDHGKKGLRAGFKFDGDVVAYHCFNCGPEMNTRYDPNESLRVPRKIKNILKNYGVPETEVQEIEFANLGKHPNKIGGGIELKATANIEPKEIKLPEEFYLLSDAKEGDKWAEVARWYLTEERGVDPDAYPYMLVRKSDDMFMRKWLGRLVVPMYKDGKLIFFQGRDLTGKKLKKYESPAVAKDKILFGFDKLFNHSDAPLYVVEGYFDAEAIDGVAILGNELTDAQIQHLDRSPRKKVYIPDRTGDGQQTAEQALDLGWCISTPDIGGNCKDMSDAVNKYGKMYVKKTLSENTHDGFAARAKLGVYCEQRRGKDTNP